MRTHDRNETDGMRQTGQMRMLCSRTGGGSHCRDRRCRHAAARIADCASCLASASLISPSFSRQYLYYTLTDKGIEYLREYLHVSEDTVPATLKKASKPQPPPSFGAGAEGGERGRGGFRGMKNS